MRVAEKLGYRVNCVARGLKTNRSFTIGMLVPDITNPFFPPMVRGVEDGLARAGYTLVLADTDNDPGKERQTQTVMLERQVDGLLLATARRRDDVIDELLKTSVPFVLVNRTIDRGGVAAVIPDDQAGMALAVDHLYDLGHRVIGHVAGPSGTSTGSRRAAGFEAAVRSCRLEPGPTVEVGSFTLEAARAVGEALSPARAGRAQSSPQTTSSRWAPSTPPRPSAWPAQRISHSSASTTCRSSTGSSLRSQRSA